MLFLLTSDHREPESTESNLRYAGYAARVRTILLAAHRYVAYTSDIGESFRPLAHPYLVKGAYGISWLYISGDVAHEGYKAYLRNQKVLHPEKHLENPEKAMNHKEPAAQALAPSTSGATDPTSAVIRPGTVAAIDDYRAVMAQRFAFQSIASMGLPAFTIHSVVRYAGRAMKDVKNVRLRSWGPIGVSGLRVTNKNYVIDNQAQLGLAVVPTLPYLFDKPVEHAIETVFHKGFELVGGPAAVGHPLTTGSEVQADSQNRTNGVKEKEL